MPLQAILTFLPHHKFCTQQALVSLPQPSLQDFDWFSLAERIIRGAQFLVSSGFFRYHHSFGGLTCRPSLRFHQVMRLSVEATDTV